MHWKLRTLWCALGLMLGVSVSSFVFARHGCNQNRALDRSRNLVTHHRDREDRCRQELYKATKPKATGPRDLLSWILCKLRPGSRFCLR